MKNVVLAKTAGFCFGVDRAVNMVFALLAENKKVATLGPIIHNAQLVACLEKKGVRIINNPIEAQYDEIVVIRSHGVSPNVYDILNERNISYKDATCPYVKKIHKIVDNESQNGKTVIIAGDKEHPEVLAICGYCKDRGKIHVVANGSELVDLAQRLSYEEKSNCILVAQTTFNTNFWAECAENAKKLYTNIKIFGTICSATDERQKEAVSLAQKSNLMLIVGGRHSSNTKKLREVCINYCHTQLIETKDELKDIDFSDFGNIGISAGASTPAYIIKEVLKTMSEILRNESEEMDFATMLEQSLESEKIYNGKRVKGIVTSFNSSEVHVDIGAKQAGIIPADELTDDPTLKVEDIVKKGDELNLSVVKVNDAEGIVTLSKKRCDAAAGFDKLKTAYDEDAILDGVITDVVRGGVLVYTCNTKIFVPASQTSDSRIENLDTLLKKQVKLKIIEINELRNRAKGSIRVVLSAERKVLQEKFWDDVSIGKKYKGEVKSLTAYGAFVDLGGIDGMIHITELSWSKVKHPSDILKQGDIVEVYIKEVDKEKKRISLGYRNADENPWNMFVQKYAVGDVVKARLVSFAGYGAFAEIIPGVDGLIHISQIANKHVEKVADVLTINDEVSVKIIEINTEKRRVSLSMRALLSENEQKADEEEKEEIKEEVTE